MDGLKQRIIGALVLISLAVIFIPMLFDEPHEEKTSKVLPIPETPPLPSITIEQPQPLDMSASEAGDNAPGVEEPPMDEGQEFGPADSYTITEIPEQQPGAQPTQREPVATSSKPSAESVSGAAKPPSPSPAATKPSVTPDAGAVSSQPALNESGLANAWTVQIGTFKSRENAYRLRDTVRGQGLKGYTRDITSSDGELVRVFAGPVLTNEEALKLKAQVDKAVNVNSLVVRYAP